MLPYTMSVDIFMNDVQIRFNNSDVVTGGRGYNAWWSKEYEGREACDLYTKF